MRILRGGITAYASEGKITLQVPVSAIFNPNPEYEDCPDEWFWKLKNGRLAHGAERAFFLFLSPAGYEANKENLRRSLEAAIEKVSVIPSTSAWEAFEKHAEKFFAEVEKSTRKHYWNLQAKLLAYESAMKAAGVSETP